MMFLAPWAFAFLGLVPVIVALYLMRVRRRSAVVSTLMFWEGVVEEKRRRALFHRLRQWWSLLLHLLIFTLILLALARPEWSRLAGGGSTVVIVDARARMQAGERFQSAVTRAAAWARRAGPGNEIALLRMGAEPEVIAPFSDDERELLEALEKSAPGKTGGDLARAVKLADEMLAARRGEGRIVVLTAGVDELPETRTALERVAVDGPRNNVAITRLAARPPFNSPQTTEVLLEVRNYGAQPARGNVEVALDGGLVEVRPFALEAGGRMRGTFALAPRAGGELTARLDTADALALDDTAAVTLPGAEPVRVLLVSAGNWFLERLLRANDRVKFDLLAPDVFKPELAGGFDVVILDGVAPEGLGAGNYLYMGRTPFDSGGVLERPPVTDVDAESPLLALANLRAVTFVRSAEMRAPAGARVPLGSDGKPLIVAQERNGHRVAAFGFGVGESDLPLRVAWPLLMANTIDWLAGPRPAAAAAELPGEAESDFRGGDGNAGRNGSYAAAWPLWVWLALAAWTLLLLEWWLFHRRRTE